LGNDFCTRFHRFSALQQCRCWKLHVCVFPPIYMRDGSIAPSAFVPVSVMVHALCQVSISYALETIIPSSFIARKYL
jgi:hypothetical protein